MNRRNRPVEITDAIVKRSIPIGRLELRETDETDNEYVLSGYASTFQEYEMYGGPANYGWIERIDPGAFNKTLQAKPDLHLLLNHDGAPLARTKSGTLSLSTDNHGLKVEARLDKRDPEAQSLAVKMQRGDLDEMSFAFRVKAQEWRAADGFEEDDQSYRTITEVSLHKGDVSVVNWGANPTASAGIRSASDALKYLAECDEEELVEARSNENFSKRAMERLAAGIANAAPTVRIENMQVCNEGVGICDAETEERESADEDSEERESNATVTVDVVPNVDGLIERIHEAITDANILDAIVTALRGETSNEPVEEEREEPKKGMSLRLALALGER